MCVGVLQSWETDDDGAILAPFENRLPYKRNKYTMKDKRRKKRAYSRFSKWEKENDAILFHDLK